MLKLFQARSLPYLWQKLTKHGLLWFIQRTIRELWHPKLAALQAITPLNKIMYFCCAQIAGLIDAIRGKVAATDTLYLFYDLEVSPITFDFGWALVTAEHKRCRLNLSYIHVVIVPGSKDGLRQEDDIYEQVIDAKARYWRIMNILMPFTNLLPSVKGLTFCVNRQHAAALQKYAKHIAPSWYTPSLPNYSTFAAELKQQLDLRFLQATDQALKYMHAWSNDFAQGRKLLSLTLRDYGYVTARNSRLAAWQQFIATLDPGEYAVAVIPDMEKSLDAENLDQLAAMFANTNCRIFTPPCWNLNLRAALYEICYLNLGVNSGPMVLCWLNKNCRYLTFKLKCDDVEHTSAQTMQWLGFSLDQSLPFASPSQRWVWADDQFEIIQREFNDTIEIIEGNNHGRNHSNTTGNGAINNNAISHREISYS